MEFIENIDLQLFLLLNGAHNSFFDPIMSFLSERWVWIPLYALLAYWLWKHYGKKVISILLFAALLITSSDQLSGVIKKTSQRYRPCHNTEILNKVHVNGSCGGQFGFVSSHAANTFGIAMFLFLLMRSYDQRKYIYVVLFVWATLVSYSRIYNGVHYPADIIGGALVGMGLASLWYAIFIKLTPKLFTNE